MKGGQDFYVTKIVTVWLATDTKQLLNGCQVVENKIGVINHCLINLICMLFLRLWFMRYLVGFFPPRLAPVSRRIVFQ